ncbi:hypothetical protein LEP1GSC186_4320 [Leptospira noguchii serovar Autumnalis str. ZUN142]|uniref:Uncharacterized protein n=1 Tax=Leptospira noguchii serovar Autumnalis str. ZUN142 TaxID=1085540 RepID=M6UHJ7_9LEPT|nr:hypothetical protein LEP1GSC186_4320 [Leptospira noguchii serovar Autumnalis str. ZUN142]
MSVASRIRQIFLRQTHVNLTEKSETFDKDKEDLQNAPKERKLSSQSVF